MVTNESGREKTAVEHLNYGEKTAKRAEYEAWSFRLVGPLQVLVTNESYGVEKDLHAYVVAVEDVGGVIVPRECECPADRFRDDYDCKHKVSLATVGGPVVMEAAAAFSEKSLGESSSVDPTPVADGGRPKSPTCECKELGELPCWSCYQEQHD